MKYYSGNLTFSFESSIGRIEERSYRERWVRKMIQTTLFSVFLFFEIAGLWVHDQKEIFSTEYVFARLESLIEIFMEENKLLLTVIEVFENWSFFCRIISFLRDLGQPGFRKKQRKEEFFR